MSRHIRALLVTVMMGAMGSVTTGCLQVESTFCGDILCPSGTVCSNVYMDTCVPAYQRNCGNGKIDEFEVCDDGGAQGVESTCDDECKSNLGCGNGVVDAESGEGCDCGDSVETAKRRASRECNGNPNGTAGGFCDVECQLFCGNGVLDDGEVCDGTLVDGPSCADFGYDSGRLRCTGCDYSTVDCTRIGWYQDADSTNTRGLRAVHGAERENAQGRREIDVFAVGEGGAWMHHDGVAWRRISTAGSDITAQTTLSAVWTSARNEVYAVSDDGMIARYDGDTVRVEFRALGRGGFVGIWAGDAAEPLALSEDGGLWHRTLVADSNDPDGARIVWEQVDTLIADPASMWVRGGSDVFVLSRSGDIHSYHCDLENPCQRTGALDDTVRYRAFFGLGDELLAVGEGGAVRRHDGTAWRDPDILQGSPDLRALWGASMDDMIILGDDGYALRWPQRRRIETTPLAAETHEPQQFTAVWQSSAGAVYAIDGARGGLWRYDGSGWILHQPDASTMRAVWGTPAGEIHALGEAGSHLYYDGFMWLRSQVTPGGEELNALWGMDTGELFAVGDAGGVYVRESGLWSSIDILPFLPPLAEIPDLMTVWCDGAGDVYIGGTGGTSFRLHDGVWDFHAIAFDGEPVQINAISGNQHGTYAASDHGLFEFSSERSRWELSHFDRTRPLFTGLSGHEDTMIAVGPAGAVFRKVTGGGWNEEMALPDPSVDLHSAWVLSNESAFVAGDGGVLWEFEEDFWSPINSFATGERLTAIWSEGDTVVVGRSDGKLGELTRRDE